MKVALITGASRGIGQAIALELASQNYKVYGSATKLENMENTVKMAQELGFTITPLALNVADENSCNDAIGKIEAENNSAITVLVNNAGITRDNLMLRMKDEEWDSVITANLTSVFRLSRLALKAMVKARFGRIINITSVVGSSGNPGQANYCATKAGVGGFSRALALEVASRNITVNCVAPGFIDTDMTRALTDEQKQMIIKKIPASRLGAPSDIAKAVAFLASDGASYITGETLHINGGLYQAA